MTPSLAEFADVFTALADPNRRAVLERLVQTGDGTATTLAIDLPFSRQAVVKHLAHLERVRLVHSQRRGREMRYTMDSGRLAATGHGMTAIAAGWDETFLALKRFAEATSRLDEAVFPYGGGQEGSPSPPPPGAHGPD